MLDIPTKFNQETIDLIKKINAKSIYKANRLPISHVYGSLTGLYSARESIRLAKVFDEDFIKHLEELDRLNVDFYYALNTSCLGPLNQREMMKLASTILKLKKFGVKNFIVAHPFLLDLIRTHIPKAKIKISVIMEIDDIRRVQYFLEKADIINISTRVNRNFVFLKTLEKYRNKIEFLCNEVCLYMCPFRDSHYTIESHRHEVDGSITVDYPTDQCYDLMSNVELIRSRFILPEWIKHYEPYGAYFKISGRTFPFEFISNVTKAYSKRESTENVLKMFPIVVGTIMNEQNGKREKRTLSLNEAEKNEMIEYFKALGYKCRYSCPCSFCSKFEKNFNG